MYHKDDDDVIGVGREINNINLAQLIDVEEEFSF